MHESAAPDQDLYQLLGVPRDRTDIWYNGQLDGRLRGAQRGTRPLSSEEWHATVLGREILGYAGRKRRYDDALAQGHRFTWVELQQLAESPLQPFTDAGAPQQAKSKTFVWLGAALAVIVVAGALLLGVLTLAGGGSGDDGGSTAAVVDSAEVVYEVGDRGTVVQADEAIDMTAVAPEAADLGLCEGQVCRGTGSKPAVGVTATGDIAVIWPGHQVTVSPDTGEIVDYTAATYPTRAEREAVLVDQSERAWDTALYRVGTDGEIIEDDLTYYETDDGTVWFITLNDRGSLFKGTVVKR